MLLMDLFWAGSICQRRTNASRERRERRPTRERQEVDDIATWGENVKFQRDRSQMGSKQLRDEESEQETAGSLAGMFFNQQIEIHKMQKMQCTGAERGILGWFTQVRLVLIGSGRGMCLV